MLVATNLNQLRYAGDYLQNVGIKFIYAPTNVFTLCGYKPNIVITNSFFEAMEASKEFLDIKFIGENLSFPGYSYNIPKALLDELSTMSDKKMQQVEIALFNPTPNNKDFIYYLRSLGNVKIMGHGFCLEELDKKFPQRLTPQFYKNTDYVACVNDEEMLKAMFMGKPCISLTPKHNCYYKLDSLKNIKPFPNQIEYAWQFSYTKILSEIFSIVGNEDISEKLLKVFNLEEKT